MQSYTKIYMNHFGYDIGDFIPCRMCGSRATEIHHITRRNKANLNDINNLCALCRECHIKAHSGEISKELLISKLKLK